MVKSFKYIKLQFLILEIEFFPLNSKIQSNNIQAIYTNEKKINQKYPRRNTDGIGQLSQETGRRVGTRDGNEHSKQRLNCRRVFGKSRAGMPFLLGSEAMLQLSLCSCPDGKGLVCRGTASFQFISTFFTGLSKEDPPPLACLLGNKLFLCVFRSEIQKHSLSCPFNQDKARVFLSNLYQKTFLKEKIFRSWNKNTQKF